MTAISIQHFLPYNITITNDRGYAVAAFNSDENVNISVIDEFETDKAHFEMSIVKPDGTAIPLDGDTAVWNTAENPVSTVLQLTALHLL